MQLTNASVNCGLTRKFSNYKNYKNSLKSNAGTASKYCSDQQGY